MIGDQNDWWNKDTPEDKILLSVITFAIELGHLPPLDKVPNRGACITYFGSCAKALERVASLLYGHKDLTSPQDLLPRERELPEEEQAKILTERQNNYQRKVQELKEPNTLSRWRSEAEDRRFARELPEGCVITKLPIYTVKELRARQNSTTTLRSTKGLIPQRSPRPAPERKKIPSFQEQWVQSSLNPANNPTASGGVNRQGLQVPKDIKQRVPRAKQSQVRQHIEPKSAKAKVHDDVKPSDEVGDEQKVNRDPSRTEQLVNTMVQTQVSQGQPSQHKQRSQNDIEKGVTDMGGRRRSREEVLKLLQEAERHFGQIPSMAQMQEYARTHPEVNMASPGVFSKLLGSKDTWEDQLREFAQSQSSDAGAAPGSAADTADSADVADDVTPTESAASQHQENAQTVNSPSSSPPARSSAGVEKSVIKINLTGLTLRFQLEGKDYELEVNFGSTGDPIGNSANTTE